jgi:hypothetical protein
MNELTQTVALAVEKMRHMRERLEELRQENSTLLYEVAKLDEVERARQEEINKRLRPIVHCIRIAQSNYLEGVTNFVPYEKEIMLLRESIETGMGEMHLFLKKSLYDPPVKLNVNGNEIRFEAVKTPFPNPFKYVYDGLDEKESPGKKNFDRYIQNFKADLDKHKSYAAIAYGPSGTGKTTMIQRIVKHLFNTHKPSIEVYQVYVRSPIMAPNSKNIPFTKGATSNKLLEDRRVHERFNLCTIEKGDIVKIILNDVRMIQSVGAQMYAHGMNLVRMITETIRNKYFTNHQAHLGEIVTSKENKLVLVESAVYQLFKGQKFRNIAGFDDTIQDKWVKPLSDTVDLVNNTRSTLHKLVTDRFQKEAEFFANSSRTVEEIIYFVESGGFIPLHWFQYMDPHFHDDIHFFYDHNNLYKLQDVHTSLYLDKKTPLKEIVEYCLNFFKFTNPKAVQESRLTPNEENNQRIADAKVELDPTSSSQKDAIARYVGAVKTIQGRFMHQETYVPETQVFQLGPKKEYVASERFIDDVQRFSFQRSTPQNQQSSRCATVYTLVIHEKPVTFIDLPGNEDQVMGCELAKDDNVLCNETLGIRSLLKYVRDLIMVKRLNVDPKTVELDYPSNEFRQIFEPLMRVECKVGLLCFAANYEASPNYTTNTLTTLQYMTGLKEAKFSCDKGANEDIARGLLTAYKAQSEEEKRLLLELAPKEAEVEKVQVSKVTKTVLTIPDILYPGVSSIENQRVALTLDYSVDDEKYNISLRGYNLKFLYRVTIEGDLMFYNKTGLVVLGNINHDRVNIDLIASVYISSKRNIIELLSENKLESLRSSFPAVPVHQIYKIYYNAVRPDIHVNNGKTRYDPYDKKNQMIPYDFSEMMSIKPPTVNLELIPSDHNIKSTHVFISPANGVRFEKTENTYMKMKLETVPTFRVDFEPIEAKLLDEQEF